MTGRPTPSGVRCTTTGFPGEHIEVCPCNDMERLPVVPSTEEPAATGTGRSLHDETWLDRYWRDKGRRWSTTVPATGLGALPLGLVVFVLTQARVYGRTYDELMQDDYGKSTLAWYLSLGHDRTFLQSPGYEQVPQHGPFADAVIAVVERFTGEQWTTRSIVAGL